MRKLNVFLSKNLHDVQTNKKHIYFYTQNLNIKKFTLSKLNFSLSFSHLHFNHTSRWLTNVNLPWNCHTKHEAMLQIVVQSCPVLTFVVQVSTSKLSCISDPVKWCHLKSCFLFCCTGLKTLCFISTIKNYVRLWKNTTEKSIYHDQ